MSTYIPHKLIHAHLPTSPSIPQSIPQLRIPSSRPFEEYDSISEPLHPEHALSFTHESNFNILGRVIHNGYTLELRPLDMTIQTNASELAGSDIIRVEFPDPIRPLGDGCIVVSELDRRVYILVVTEANCLYRLQFPFSHATIGTGHRFSFTTKGNDDWAEEWDIPYDHLTASGGVTTWTVVDEQYVILGCGDGGIIRLNRSSRGVSGHWSAHHHRVSSRFRLPSLFSSTSSDESVLSFASFRQSSQTLLYALSRDRKLRVWNPFTGALLKTVDVRISSSTALTLRTSQTASSPSTSAPLPETSATLIQIVPHPSPSSKVSHIVIVFLGTPYSSTSPGSFTFYRVSKSGDLLHAGEKDGNTLSAGSELRGFEILPPIRSESIDAGWKLWGTWDAKGSLVSESIIIDDLLQFTTYIAPHNASTLLYDWQRAVQGSEISRYEATYFDNLLSTEPPDPTDPHENGDIAELFLSHLFLPGRFSALTLSTVFDDYIAQLPRDAVAMQASQASPTLSGKFAATVGTNIHMTFNPQTGAPEVQDYRANLKLAWLGIWSNAVRLDLSARWPIGTTLVDSELVVISREGLDTVVPEDTAGLLHRLGASDDTGEFLDLPDGALRNSLSCLAPPGTRANVASIASAGHLLSEVLISMATEDGTGVLDPLIDSINITLSRPLQGPVELVLGSIWDEYLEPYLDDEGQSSIRRLLPECSNLIRGLSDVLQILANTSIQPERPTEGLRFSGLGNSLLAADLTANISARYKLARNALFVGIFHLAENAVTADDEEGEELFEVLSRALVIYHRYAVLHWLAEQDAEEPRTRKQKRASKRRNGEDGLAEGFDSLRMREAREEGEDDGVDTSYSLLHSLLAGAMAQPVRTGSFSPLYSASNTLLDSTWSVDHDQVDVEPTSRDVRLAYTVLEDGHPTLAGRLTAMYPPSAGILYVKARAYLDLGEVDEAVINFEKAASSYNDVDLTETLGLGIQPTVTSYYRYVTRLFEDRGVEAPIVHFGLLALNSTEPTDPTIKDIWTKVFLADLSLQRYEDAYAVLSDTPYDDVKRDFLGQLISHMCEANQVGRLNDLCFVGIQKDVAELLAFKARHSDPLRAPNYYKVLYSWHVTRGDFRSAGSVMYDQARRLGQSIKGGNAAAFEITAMQARSYLACINALSLLKKRLAWLAVPLPVVPHVRGNKRRRVTSYIPDEEFSTDKPQLDIVTLEDIQAEYATVLSRLQLAAEKPDLIGHGRITIEPAQLVGMFLQRSMYDEAQSAAATLGVDMTDLFVALAQRCVQLSRLSDISSDLEIDAASASFLYSSPVTARLRGPPSALALRYLQSALARHDSPKTQWKYRIAVADELFTLNNDAKSGWQMPAWLVEWEMDRDPEGWISRALSHGWVAEAVEWTLELLRRATPPELLAKGKSDVAYTAYNLIDRVIVATQEGSEKDDLRIQGKVKTLREGVERRINGMKKLAS